MLQANQLRTDQDVPKIKVAQNVLKHIFVLEFFEIRQHFGNRKKIVTVHKQVNRRTYTAVRR